MILTDTQRCENWNHWGLENKESASCGDGWCFMDLHNDGPFPSLPLLCLALLEDVSWGCIVVFWTLFLHPMPNCVHSSPHEFITLRWFYRTRV